MIVGRLPFKGLSLNQVLQSIDIVERDGLTVTSSMKISDKALELISKMLQTDFMLRIPLSEAHHDEWIMSNEEDTKIDTE